MKAMDELMSRWGQRSHDHADITRRFSAAHGHGPPFLDDDGVMLENQRRHCSMPANDPDFQAWTKMISDKYGWPRSDQAMELWNEPWRVFISGWGAD